MIRFCCLQTRMEKAASAPPANPRPFGATNVFSSAPYEPEYVRKVIEWFRKNDEGHEPAELPKMTESVESVGK
ncbi:hypothetical protein Q1695_009534 [Nippostrongylus brasiliensis]|nr:hypothetical protein Q1695_009534 [Nippostrongylus brasiliensis]